MKKTVIALVAILSACGYTPETEEGDVSVAEQASTAETINVASSSMVYRSLYVMAGYRYTFCVNTTSGNADIYGKTGSQPTTTNYQAPYVSRNVGGLHHADCIWFTADASATFYIGIYGASSGTSTAKYWYVGSAQANIPSGFSKGLTWPLGNYKDRVNWWSEFNSPWGNPQAVNAPFFADSANDTDIHKGMDVYAPPGTTVVTACSGTVKKNGFLGTGWGYYVVQECTKGSTTLSIAYDHLESAGRPAENTPVTEGVTTIGKIYAIDTTLHAGEDHHLHLAICKGTYASCGSPQSGSMIQSSFPGNYINPWIVTNPGLFK